MIYSKQVTRGHNIVANGWAGASNPHPHPNPHTQNISETLVFPLFDLIITNGQTDGWADRWMDKASYRVTCPQLKTQNKLL